MAVICPVTDRKHLAPLLVLKENSLGFMNAGLIATLISSIFF